jgi:hypothetical protein
VSGKACEPPCAVCVAEGRHSVEARAAYHSRAARFERLRGGRHFPLRGLIRTVVILVILAVGVYVGGRLGILGR